MSEIDKPHDRRENEVTATVGPTGRYSVLTGRLDASAGNYVWEGIAAGGARSLSFGHGTFVLDVGQTFADGLRACAGRIDDAPAHQVMEGRKFLSAMAGWTGEAAVYRDHLASICGPCTLPIAAEWGDPGEIAALDRVYGRDRVEAVLGRMPVLFAPLRVLLGENPTRDVRESCDAIMQGAGPTLDELAGHVATLVGTWRAQRAFVNDVNHPVPPARADLTPCMP
jgi:hypothetical protein